MHLAEPEFLYTKQALWAVQAKLPELSQTHEICDRICENPAKRGI